MERVLLDTKLHYGTSHAASKQIFHIEHQRDGVVGLEFSAPATLLQRKAAKLDCEVQDDCTCYPAETKANCKCRQISIATWFESLQHRFPVITPTMAFRRDKDGLVQASVSKMVTSEIVLNLDNEYATNILVDEAICRVSNAVLTGCYNCAKGAQARIICRSSRPAQAEIVCSDASFVVPCNVDGVESLLRFSFTKARINSRCSVSCGPVLSTFEIGGILKFTRNDKLMNRKPNKQLSRHRVPRCFPYCQLFAQWMAERDVDSDIAYLSTLILHRHTALNRVHEDLKAIEEAFHREISVASMI
ncbi:hypothetical protein COOONC_00306 [Cooperia oncophora]